MSAADEIARSTDPVSLTRFIMAERSQFKEATGSFAMLLQSIQLACKVISTATRKAGLANLFGVAAGQTQNTSGDQQKKLDVLANDVMINCISYSDQAYILCSEENDAPIVLDNAKGGYSIVFDPLDGSSNIDCNLSVGTIFGIYKKDPKSTARPSAKDLLKPGNELIAAGYAMYDAATVLVLSTGLGVNGFTLDPSLGEFILSHKNIRIPRKGKIYSINEANSLEWDAPTTKWIEGMKKKKASARYVGAMVGDIHRTLLYGGVFAYPPDRKNPNGKLRLLYECNPISFLIEQAGGKSTTGNGRVLDVVPTSLHQRVPIFCGSADDITEIDELYKKHVAAGGANPAAAKAKL
jgi:fructose-1,6-bisphosphatase I